MTNREYKIDDAVGRLKVSESFRDPLALSMSKAFSTTRIAKLHDFRAYAKTNLDFVGLIDFAHGNKINHQPDPDNWIIGRCRDLVGSEDFFYFVEDWTARPDDSFISSEDVPAVFDGQDVYYAVKSAEQATLRTWPRILWNLPPLFLMFLVSGAPRNVARSSISEQTIMEYAERTVGIVIGVYDGESYLVCRCPGM